MNRKVCFYVAVALQLTFLGWMVAAKERALANGMRIVLAVRPVDPIDHLSGRYIRITPAIERIDTTKVPVFRGDAGDGPDPSAASGPITGPVFVELVQEGEVWVASRVVVEGAGVPPHTPFVRAIVTWPDATLLHLEYEFERFYIPADGHDPSFLASDPSHTVRVVVRVAKDGNGVTEDLLIDGKTWKEWDAAERARGR